MNTCSSPSTGAPVAVQHGSPEHASVPVVRPAADVIEREDDFLVAIDLPGVAESDVEIRHDRGILSVSANRNRPSAAKPDDVLLREFGAVRYARAFRLPEDGSIDAARIGARLNAGVLEITLPKAAEAKPRRIPVNG